MLEMLPHLKISLYTGRRERVEGGGGMIIKQLWVGGWGLTIYGIWIGLRILKLSCISLHVCHHEGTKL